MEENIIIAQGKNVLIEDISVGPEKQGNFYLPPSTTQKIRTGKVINIGFVGLDGYEELKAGDTVFYNVLKSEAVFTGGREFKIVPLEDILAIVSKNNESD